MIDLGDELAGFDEEPKPKGATVTRYGSGPDGMHSFGKLADLKKGGFNVNPRTGRGIGDPHRDFGMYSDPPQLPDPLTDDSKWTIVGTLADDFDLKIDFRTWFGDDDLRTLTATVIPNIPAANQVVDALRQDAPLADIVVPDQPFKWKPHVVASRTFAAKCKHGSMVATCRRCSK